MPALRQGNAPCISLRFGISMLMIKIMAVLGEYKMHSSAQINNSNSLIYSTADQDVSRLLGRN